MSYNLDPKKMTKEDWLLTNCKEHSLYLIANTPKTEKQLRDKLKKNKKYNEEIIEKTIEFLKKYNYINDEEFTKRYIEIYSSKKTKREIEQKLYIKGVNRNIIKNALEEKENLFDEMAIGEKLLLKKLNKFDLDNFDIKDKQKIFSFLMRKGISIDTIESLLNKYLK